MSEAFKDMIEPNSGKNPAAFARRSSLTAGWRHVREKFIASGTGNRSFDVELLRLFAQSRMTSVPALAFIALSAAVMSFMWTPEVDVVVWLGIVWSCHLVSYKTARSLMEQPEAELQVQAWRRRFVATELCHGLAWAMLTVLFLNEPDATARIFVLFVLLLISALTSLISATVPMAVYAGLMPTTIAVVLYMHPVWQEQAWPVALMACGAQFFFLVLAQRLYATSLSSLSFRLEKDMLIAELEQAKANSDEARRRAEEANLAKSSFLATMSHELRTPLNAILGFSEVMKNELFGRHGVAAYKDYSSDIHSSGQHLLMLINEILDLSRVEAGRYELREEPVSLAHVVEECLHLLSLRAEQREITITRAIEAQLPRIWGDERALRQITLNLLTNAIKFTPSGGHVTLKCGWTQSGGQYISIRDTGPGIPEDEIPVVLSSFGRGSLAQKNAEEGSGLGLPIVKGLVDLHGGTFHIQSELRQGTEVTVILPTERVIEAMAQVKPARTRDARTQTRKAA